MRAQGRCSVFLAAISLPLKACSEPVVAGGRALIGAKHETYAEQGSVAGNNGQAQSNALSDRGFSFGASLLPALQQVFSFVFGNAWSIVYDPQ